MINEQIALPLSEIQSFCEQRPIQKLSIFGSAIREDFTPESDVDMLVEFVPDAGITYFDLFDIQDTLARLINHKVDLLTPAALSPYFRDDVLKSAVTVYERQ